MLTLGNTCGRAFSLAPCGRAHLICAAKVEEGTLATLPVGLDKPLPARA